FNQTNLSAAPFAFNGSDSKLELILKNVTGSPIRLYFEIDDRCSVPRNPFTDAFQVPRIIEWSINGVTFTPDTDETHALSQSGFVTFTPEESAEQLTVMLDLREKGCEEEVRLRNISARTVTAVQRRTYTEPLAFDVDGLPNLSLPLPVTDGYVLANELVLRVRTGSGYERWNYTDDLNSAASGEKVFTLDAKRENVLFGDGEYGAVVPKGEDIVVIEKLPVSYLERGNIPAGTMRIDDSEFFAENSAASGGRSTETVRETARRLAKRLRNTNKCVSADDYKRAALNTPGVRVAAAEVYVGFDPDAPTEKSTLPVVTINVLPANETGSGLPDERFIDTVYRYLNSKRPIGVTVKVI
ncbi:MAG: baseplate J/gp47 family protein, partial [Oscillospiraceae bacterium]|nr:baseplate J/gp47 family protein [Oscillospiraceae bacterium]